MTWRKLNYLVPEPQCTTKGGVVVEWNDIRRQPTQTEIDAVDMADVEAAEVQGMEDNFTFDGVMLTIAKALHNHENRIRALEGKASITIRQVVTALRAL